MKKVRKASARNASEPSARTVKVIRVVCLELRVPAHVRDPRRAAEQAMRHWPNRKALKDRGIEVVRVEEGVETNEACN